MATCFSATQHIVAINNTSPKNSSKQRIHMFFPRTYQYSKRAIYYFSHINSWTKYPQTGSIFRVPYQSRASKHTKSYWCAHSSRGVTKRDWGCCEHRSRTETQPGKQRDRSADLSRTASNGFARFHWCSKIQGCVQSQSSWPDAYKRIHLRMILTSNPLASVWVVERRLQMPARRLQTPMFFSSSLLHTHPGGIARMSGTLRTSLIWNQVEIRSKSKGTLSLEMHHWRKPYSCSGNLSGLFSSKWGQLRWCLRDALEEKKRSLWSEQEHTNLSGLRTPMRGLLSMARRARKRPDFQQER